MEAYRLARTNLMYSSAREETPIYAVTSVLPDEGKSLNCSNLAISYALAGVKTLIVDCDMRNPTQVVTFDCKVKSGLSEYLAGVRKDAVVQKTSYDNLFVLTSGKISPNPAELLGSLRMRELLASLREEYECVFLDLPPVSPVSDAMILSSIVTGYILIVNANRCDSRSLKRALSAFEQVDANIIGTVFNGVEQKTSRRRGLFGKKDNYGYGYRYEYGYGYGYGAEASTVEPSATLTPELPRKRKSTRSRTETTDTTEDVSVTEPVTDATAENGSDSTDGN